MEHPKPPKALTDVGLEMPVDVIKLRELPLPVVDIDIQDLIWQFDMPVWAKDSTEDWNLTPWEVIKKAPGSTAHQKRVEDADLIHPIVLTKYRSRFVALDGIHRTVKAYLAGQKTIKAKVIPGEYLSKEEFQSRR